MGKKCIICEQEAQYKIKDTSDYYCAECAGESFADLSILLKIEEEVKRLQKFLQEKIDVEKLNEKAKVGEEKEVEEIVKENKDSVNLNDSETK